ncbi:MAG TPA: potassium-transporting ATPase subunit KdpC [Steroidobacteraceae bacterium]|nr:potassium-transporting ATPase subunit KdpC [Steroidobacteraceae bacterium]
MLKQIRPALVLLLLMTALTGVIYPLVITLLSQAIWGSAAHGSLVKSGDVVVGSSLIGQSFANPAYFQARPSGAGKGYDGTSSSGTNLGPTSKALIDAVRERVAAARADGGTGPVPADLVTSSGSGLDPDLSVAAAEWQVERVAHARGVAPQAIRELLSQQVTRRDLGFLGAPRINVLRLNLALDAKFPRPGR